MPEKQSSERFRIKVADDQMSATLCSDGPATITAAEVLARLQELKIQSVNAAAINTAVAAAASGPLSSVIASGHPVMDEKPGRFTFKTPVADAVNGLVSHVTAGQLIAVTAKPIPGKDGQDIFGKPIAQKKICSRFSCLQA